MINIIFSTGNDDKFILANSVCDEYGIKLMQNSLEIDEIQSEDAERIAIDKANKAYELIQKPVLVSDDSWEIPGLNGFPGAYMKSINHWLTVDDFMNLTKPLADKRIFLIQYIAYKDNKVTKVFRRKREGYILDSPMGGQGPLSRVLISMAGDEGLSIAEVYAKGGSHSQREVANIWHEFAEWFVAHKEQ